MLFLCILVIVLKLKMNLRVFLILNPRALLLVGVFILSIALFFFSLGIAEASYLDTHNSSDLRYAYWEVRLNIVLICVVNFLSAIVLIPTLVEIYYGDITRGIIMECIGASLLSRIWTCVIFFGMPNSCAENYKEHAPKLLTFLEIEVCVLFILCIAAMCGILMHCCLGSTSDVQQVTPTSGKDDAADLELV